MNFICHTRTSTTVIMLIYNLIYLLTNSSLSIQDMLVPISQLKGSLECFHEEVEIYPIWLCPFKLPNNPGMLRTHYQDGEMEKMLVDVGVYGVPQKSSFETVSTTRRVESFVRNVQG